MHANFVIWAAIIPCEFVNGHIHPACLRLDYVLLANFAPDRCMRLGVPGHVTRRAEWRERPTMISSKQLAAGILATSAAAWLRQGAVLLLYGISARTLDSRQIGIFALGSALVLVIEYGAFDAISETVVQRRELEPGHVGAALTTAAIFAALTVLTARIFAEPLAAIFATAPLAGALPWMGASVGVMCLSAPHAGLLRRQARFHTISVLASVAAVVACGTGSVLLLLGFGMPALIAYFMIEKLILAAGTVACTVRHPIGRFSARQARDLVAYASPIFCQRAVSYLCNQMDRLLIAGLLGPAVLGVYQIAARISESLNSSLLDPISKLFFVHFARLQVQPEPLRRAFRNAIEAVAFIVFPATLGLAVVGPELVNTLFGSNWGLSGHLLRGTRGWRHPTQYGRHERRSCVGCRAAAFLPAD